MLNNLRFKEDKNGKMVNGTEYNYFLDKKTGYFVRWGKTLNEDPILAPAPEILDIEVSTICSKGCKSCYKGNTSNGENMDFETFKQVLDNIRKPGLLCQLAFGIGDIRANLDLFKMANYAREVGIIPNITINGEGMTSSFYDSLVKFMGAVAVSRYNKDTCYQAVQELTRRGMDQVNIHMLLSEETIDECFRVVDDYHEDIRLKRMKAIVFLLLKPKGRGVCMTPLRDREEYQKLIDYAFERKTPIGFDSCDASAFMSAIEKRQDYDRLSVLVESCESSLFSSYCSVDGKFFPCSFARNTPGWEDGIDLVDCHDFVEEVWLNEKTVAFRKKLLDSQEHNQHNCRECPIYNLKMK